MISLLVHLKDYKKESVLAPLFKMLEASFELFVPLVMAAVIDVGIAQKDRPYIVKMCFVLIALGIIGLVCSITAQYFAAKAASGFATGVRHALFEHIQKFTFTEMDTLGTSTLITRGVLQNHNLPKERLHESVPAAEYRQTQEDSPDDCCQYYRLCTVELVSRLLLSLFPVLPALHV